MDPHRHGARQPERFDPERAAALDDPSRFAYLPVQDVLSLLDIPQGGLWVDFGAGTGAYARAIARLRPDAAVVALDEQPPMLALLQAALDREKLANIKPALSTPREIASLRGRADRVLALNVLHEIGDASLGDLASLLKTGGKAVFIDWNASVDRPVGPPKGHVFSPSEGRSRLESFGWSILAASSFPYHYALVGAL
jgi:S-adenosylmethionine-diacylgycerolhomoserine-N-methlytransferase